MHRIPQQDLLVSVLEAATRVDHAVGGSVRQVAPDGRTLDLTAIVGLPDEYPEHFGDGSAYAQAMAERRRVVIRDVEVDAAFARHRKVAAACGFRAVQATPLIGRESHLLGLLSTYFAEPHHPSTASLKDLDRCCRVAAFLIEANELRKAVEALDRVVGVPYRALSPSAAHAADAARMLLPLLGQDAGQVLLAKVESYLGVVVEELGALKRRLTT